MIEDFYTYIYYDTSRNNEPFYVGKGRRNRAWKHYARKEMHPMTQQMQLLKRNNIKPIIGIYGGLDEEFALLLEIELIQKFGRKDLGKGPLLNLTDGGEGISGAKRIFSKEHKEKLSQSAKCKPKSEEHKLHVKEKRALQIISPETCKKISEAQTGEKNHFYGKTHTEEYKKRMSILHKERHRQNKLLKESI